MYTRYASLKRLAGKAIEARTPHCACRRVEWRSAALRWQHFSNDATCAVAGRVGQKKSLIVYNLDLSYLCGLIGEQSQRKGGDEHVEK